MQPLKTMDGRNACILNLKGVSVSGSQMIGRLNGAYPLLNDVIDQATVAVCSEMVGGMKAALDMTVAYLCERVQFGKPIGSFQSIQHKVADMFIEQELAVAATYYATAAVSENSEDRASAVSLAKAKCSSAYVEITKRAIQLFGAIGFSNEADIGFYLKRAKVTEILFGDSDYHLRRYTDLKGY